MGHLMSKIEEVLMDTKPLVDPELALLLDQLPTFQFTRQTLPQIRALFKELFEQQKALAPAFEEIEVTEHYVPGPVGTPKVRVLVYRPKNHKPPLPALLWIHGGGYVIGSPETDDVMIKVMVRQLGCLAVSVDYRLAPETVFPGQLEDCYAALKWLYSRAAELEIDPKRIALGGASAGGGLAATLALFARDRGEVPIAFQLLIYPMLDDRTASSPNPHPYTGEFIWTAQANHFGWASLLGKEPGTEDVSFYAAAARAENLSGLPATFISVGALDLFVEEDLEYARRLIRTGVPTELHLYRGAYHGFNLAETAQVTKAFERDYLNALRRALHPNQKLPT